MSMLWIWAIVIAVALVVEFVTMQMVSVWVALGGFVGLILEAIGGIGFEIQITAFFVVSLLAIFFLRRFAVRFLERNSESKKAETIIGKKIKLLEDTNEDLKSTAKLNGVVWTVIAEQPLKKGNEVVITETIGNKLKVKFEEKNN